VTKPRVRKSRKDGRWIAELPILEDGALVGWYSERFDRQEFALQVRVSRPCRKRSVVVNRPTDLGPMGEAAPVKGPRHHPNLFAIVGLLFAAVTICLLIVEVTL
jgi:hypothetical protein